MSNTEVIRIIGCQGSIQFMTAIHALGVHAHRAERQHALYRNYLLVYDLYAPNGQSGDFFQFIKGMTAQGNVPFEKVIYIDPLRVQELIATYQKQGTGLAGDALLALIGVDKIHELYLSTNWQPVNKLLINCFASARKICYGDSIGLHIPEHYFSDQHLIAKIKQLPVVRSVKRLYDRLKLGFKFPNRRPVFEMLREVQFDTGYYITVNLVRKKPSWEYHLTNRTSLLEVFQQYSSLLSLDEIKDFFLRGKNLSIMMTTNFSEAGRMSMENELNAYLEFTQKHLPRGASLIIKPHPRDSKVKLDALRQLLLDNSYEPFILEDIRYYFVPFELFLLRIKERYPELLDSMRYFTFSSSCLSIRFLFNLQAYVGMGDDLVNKYINPSHRSSRIKHEHDLNRLLATG